MNGISTQRGLICRVEWVRRLEVKEVTSSGNESDQRRGEEIR